MPELYSYDGFFSLKNTTERQHAELEALATNAPVELEMARTYLSFEYEGRDTNRHVLHLFSKVAKIAVELEGELRCTISTDDGDPVFEFYTIADSQLFLQRGRLEREPSKTPVDP